MSKDPMTFEDLQEYFKNPTIVEGGGSLEQLHRRIEALEKRIEELGTELNDLFSNNKAIPCMAPNTGGSGPAYAIPLCKGCTLPSLGTCVCAIKGKK